MSTRNKLSLALVIISLALLYPGLYFPLLTIEVGAEIPLVGRIEVFNQTRSIIQSIVDLFDNNNAIVALLILLFSIVIPVIKGVICLVVPFIGARGYRFYKLVYAIGKWSMADVFVVGVFIAWMATKSDQFVNAYLHEGFYYFVGYCLVSLFGIQLLKIDKPAFAER